MYFCVVLHMYEVYYLQSCSVPLSVCLSLCLSEAAILQKTKMAATLGFFIWCWPNFYDLLSRLSCFEDKVILCQHNRLLVFLHFCQLFANNLFSEWNLYTSCKATVGKIAPPPPTLLTMWRVNRCYEHWPVSSGLDILTIVQTGQWTWSDAFKRYLECSVPRDCYPRMCYFLPAKPTITMYIMYVLEVGNDIRVETLTITKRVDLYLKLKFRKYPAIHTNYSWSNWTISN